jgi:hypothetical protein
VLGRTGAVNVRLARRSAATELYMQNSNSKQQTKMMPQRGSHTIGYWRLKFHFRSERRGRGPDEEYGLCYVKDTYNHVY